MTHDDRFEELCKPLFEDLRGRLERIEKVVCSNDNHVGLGERLRRLERLVKVLAWAGTLFVGVWLTQLAKGTWEWVIRP